MARGWSWVPPPINIENMDRYFLTMGWPGVGHRSRPTDTLKTLIAIAWPVVVHGLVRGWLGVPPPETLKTLIAMHWPAVGHGLARGPAPKKH